MALGHFTFNNLTNYYFQICPTTVRSEPRAEVQQATKRTSCATVCARLNLDSFEKMDK